VNASELLTQLPLEAQRRPYILRLEILELTSSLIKARLIISPDLFVQVYHNDQFDSTNLVLIHNQRRIYGRDQLGGVWHRHTLSEPDAHDKSKPGQQAVTIDEFLNEVEPILADLGLP
jgi:hypothetical protein